MSDTFSEIKTPANFIGRSDAVGFSCKVKVGTKFITKGYICFGNINIPDTKGNPTQQFAEVWEFTPPGTWKKYSWPMAGSSGGQGTDGPSPCGRENPVAFVLKEGAIDVAYIAMGNFSGGWLNDIWKFNPTLLPGNPWVLVKPNDESDINFVGRIESVAFAINGKGYIGTGITANPGSKPRCLSDFWEFDPVTKALTRLSDLPLPNGATGVYGATGFSIGDIGYIFFGTDQIDGVANIVQNGAFAFSRGASSNNGGWFLVPDLDGINTKPFFRGATSFVLNGKGYTGINSRIDPSINYLYEYTPSEAIHKLRVVGNGYNPDASPLSTPSPRSTPISFSIGQFGYIGTGYGPKTLPDNTIVQTYFNDFYKYTP